MSKLIPVEKLEETALAGAMSTWTAYKLIRAGLLPAVRIGRRVFLTEEGIQRFIEGGGAGQPARRGTCCHDEEYAEGSR